MHEDSSLPFRDYLRTIRDGLNQLAPGQWSEIEYELLTHLDDAAADAGVSADDPAFQLQVIEQLGGSTEMIHAFHHAYDRRPRLLVLGASLLAFLAGLSTASIAIAMSIIKHDSYIKVWQAAERWIGRWDESRQIMVWSLEAVNLPHPALFLLSTCVMAVIGILLLVSALHYLRGRPPSYRLMKGVNLGLIFALILVQGFGTTRFLFAEFALVSLLGLLCAWLAERRRRPGEAHP